MKLQLSKDTFQLVHESHDIGDSWHETISIFTKHVIDEILDHALTVNPMANQLKSFELKVTTVPDRGNYYMDTIHAKAKVDAIAEEIEVECRLND